MMMDIGLVRKAWELHKGWDKGELSMKGGIDVKDVAVVGDKPPHIIHMRDSFGNKGADCFGDIRHESGIGIRGVTVECR